MQKMEQVLLKLKLKVLYVGLTAVELGIAVQMQNIGDGFFFSPGPSDLTHTQVARLTTPTGTSAHGDE